MEGFILVKVREEVLNVEFAKCLVKRGFVAAPESIINFSEGKRLPDVLVKYRGLRIIIEGKIGEQHKMAIKAAKKRVEEGHSHISVAVLYPQDLSLKFEDLSSQFEKTNFEVCFVTETGPSDWQSLSIENFGKQLFRIYSQLIEEDIVETALSILLDGINIMSNSFKSIPSASSKIMDILGIGEAENSTKAKREDSANRIASLTLINALIFQEELSSHNANVKPLNAFNKNKLSAQLLQHWSYIIEKIDYFSIFFVGKKLLEEMPAHINNDLFKLCKRAQEIVSLRAALRHDLMGRVFHRLLVEAKFLGTYYTSVPAATMLLNLALKQENFLVEWDSPKSISKLKIADIACGTGTLLIAATQAILDNHIQSSIEKNQPIEVSNLFKELIEKTIWGYDVVASSLHLTASALSLLAPAVSFERMNLYNLPLGGKTEKRLGSIDFLNKANPSIKHPGGLSLPIRQTLFSASEFSGSEQVTGAGLEFGVAEIPQLDLCVINPPFTRSAGGNLLFGSLPLQERKTLQKELSNIVRKPNIQANNTAGLGAVFVAVADKVIKEGGILALVLPRSLLTGEAWKKTRELLNSNYWIKTVIVSHEPGRNNFSENTSLSELLLIAQKTKTKEDKQTLWVHLWKNPTKTTQALSLMNILESKITSQEIPDLKGSSGICRLTSQSYNFAEAFFFNQGNLDNKTWHPQAYAQTELNRAVNYLKERNWKWSTSEKAQELPLCKLKTLVDFGPDRRDIYDGFNPSDSFSSFKAFWGHKTEEIDKISQEPNKFLSPLTSPKKNRPLRNPEQLWKKSGYLLVAEGIRVNNTRTSSIFLEERVLSNVWWPLTFRDSERKDFSKILSLWLNSSLGLLLLLAHREDTEGSWVGFKKPSLEIMPVLNPFSLEEHQQNTLLKAFDTFSKMSFKPLKEIHADETRKKLDTLFAATLGLNHLDFLRKALGKEPLLTNKPLE